MTVRFTTLMSVDWALPQAARQAKSTRNVRPAIASEILCMDMHFGWRRPFSTVDRMRIKVQQILMPVGLSRGATLHTHIQSIEPQHWNIA